MDAAQLVIFIGLLIFVSHLFAGIFEKRGIPDVLMLMIIGIIIGPVLNLVTPESFGIVTGIFTTITLVFILFQGGLDLRFETMQSALRGMTFITCTNFGATTLVVGLIAWLLLGLFSSRNSACKTAKIARKCAYYLGTRICAIRRALYCFCVSPYSGLQCRWYSCRGNHW